MIDFHRPSSRRDQLCPFSPQTRDQTQNGMAFGASLSERKRSSASHNKPHRMKSAATLNYGCKNVTPSDLSASHLMYFIFLSFFLFSFFPCESAEFCIKIPGHVTQPFHRLNPPGPFCFTSTEVRWLIRDGDRGGGKGTKE